MSFTKNVLKLSEISSETDNTQEIPAIDDQGSLDGNPTMCCTYAVTVSKKLDFGEDETAFCSGQKSFISIHSTDQLCQVLDVDKSSNIEEANVEILSLNEVFPTTSEESLDDGDFPLNTKKNLNKNKPLNQKVQSEIAAKTTYVPTNSKSSTLSGRQKETVKGQSLVYSDFDIPKNTMYVVGSNPGEPKMNYPDPPKKISKVAKKLLRSLDKNKQNAKSNDKQFNKLSMRGILKDGRCGPECTGDSMQGVDVYNPPEDLTLPFDFGSHSPYTKHGSDKNVTFNTQVVIIHFTGDLCVGQSVESLSKEKDQQARNSELRKAFLAKYNEFWPTQK